jgi:hypothetical protein
MVLVIVNKAERKERIGFALFAPAKRRYSDSDSNISFSWARI